MLCAVSALAGTPSIPPSNQEDEAENADYEHDDWLTEGEPLRRVVTNRSVHVSGDPTSRVNPSSLAPVVTAPWEAELTSAAYLAITPPE